MTLQFVHFLKVKSPFLPFLIGKSLQLTKKIKDINIVKLSIFFINIYPYIYSKLRLILSKIILVWEKEIYLVTLYKV